MKNWRRSSGKRTMIPISTHTKAIWKRSPRMPMQLRRKLVSALFTHMLIMHLMQSGNVKQNQCHHLLLAFPYNLCPGSQQLPWQCHSSARREMSRCCKGRYETKGNRHHLTLCRNRHWQPCRGRLTETERVINSAWTETLSDFARNSLFQD